MTSAPDLDRLDCPGCPGKIPIRDLRAETVRCPECGAEWRIKLQDLPGSRFLIDLAPPTGTN